MKYSNITISWDYESDAIDHFIIYRSEDQENIILDDNNVVQLSGDSRSFIDLKIYANTTYYYVIGAFQGDRVKYSQPLEIKSGENDGFVEWNFDTFTPIIYLDSTSIRMDKIIDLYGNEFSYTNIPTITDDNSILLDKNILNYNGLNMGTHKNMWYCFLIDILDSYNVNYSTPFTINGENYNQVVSVYQRNALNNEQTRIMFNLKYEFPVSNSKFMGKKIVFAYLDMKSGYTYFKQINDKNLHEYRSINSNSLNFQYVPKKVSIGGNDTLVSNAPKMKLYNLSLGFDALDKTSIDRIIGKLSWEHNFQDILPESHPYKKFKPLPTLNDLDLKNSEILRFKKWQAELNSLSGMYNIGGKGVDYPNSCTSGSSYACSRWSFKQDGSLVTATLDGYNTGIGGNYYDVANNPISVISMEFDDVVKNIDLVNSEIDDKYMQSVDTINKIAYFDFNTSVSKSDNIVHSWTDSISNVTVNTLDDSIVTYTQDGILFNNSSMTAENILKEYDTTNYTIIFVGKMLAYKTGKYFVMARDHGGYIAVFKDVNTLIAPHAFDYDPNGTSYRTSTGTFQSDGNFILLLTVGTDGRYGKIRYYTEHGMFSNSRDYPQSMKTNGFKSISIGHNSLEGDVLIKSMIIDNSNVDDNLDKNIAILAHKYKMTEVLPKDHPYKYIPPLKD